MLKVSRTTESSDGSDRDEVWKCRMGAFEERMCVGG